MDTNKDMEKRVLMVAREYGVSSVLFRNAIARKLGLNVTDAECLSFLAINGVSTPTQLARHTGLTTGAATAMLDRLERADLIRRRPNPKDRRGVLVEINERYWERVGPMVAGVQEAHKELLAGYSDKELGTIADFLTRFTGNVTEHTKRIEKMLANG